MKKDQEKNQTDLPTTEPPADAEENQSPAAQHFNDFHAALAPPKINKVLISLFTMLADSDTYGSAEQ